MTKILDTQFLYISHGYGRQEYLDGSVYEGDWRKGICHGLGSLTFPNGLNYKGSFHEGKINGKGILYALVA